MTTQASGSPRPRSRAGPALGLIEAKLHVPRGIRHAVTRRRLLQRLETAGGQPVVSIVAPAGYGKTSVLTQWAAAGARPAAWLTIEPLDNDPATFLTYLASAIEGVTPIEPRVFELIASRVSDRSVIGHLLAALAEHPGPLLLAFDDVHHLTDQACLDAFAELITYQPSGVRVALVGREPPTLPFERWRLEGRLLEIGPNDLALDRGEADALLRSLDLRLPEAALEQLLERTEGWPALVALAVTAAHRAGAIDPLASLQGIEASAYLRSEVLDARPQRDVEFLLRSSMLERLNGPSCDAVLEVTGSADRLDALARSTILVDDYGGWYRYHPILREFLAAEHERRAPGMAARLHLRAAHWHRAAGDMELAVEHAFRAGEWDLAMELVGASLSRYHWSGRRATVRGWLQRFNETSMEERPGLAVMAGWELVSEGDVVALERFVDLVDQGTHAGPMPDGSASLESARAMLHAVVARRGADDMLANAEVAARLETTGSDWNAFAMWLLALARVVTGDPDGAEQALAAAIAASRHAGHEGLTYCLLGHRALLLMDRGDWAGARKLMAEADRVGIAGRLEGYLSAALARVASIRLLLDQGVPGDVRRELARAASVRPMLTAAAPAIAVLALAGFARLHLAVGDPAGARALLTQADEVLRQRSGLGVLPAQVAALRDTLAALPIGLAGASTLTAAELRVLALLPYYLSFKEIGQRLGVKATTVKTHALSIYGKLGATSRGEAIDLAVQAGLLERFPVPNPSSPPSGRMRSSADDAGVGASALPGARPSDDG